MSVTNWRRMWVIKHPKDRLVFVSSWTSSIVCKMCLQRQKGVQRVAFLRVSTLRRACGQKLVTTIFAKNRCIGGKSTNTDLRVGFLLPCGRAPKKSRRWSMLGASTPSGKGTPRTGSIGTVITALMSYESIWMVGPLATVYIIKPLSSSWVIIIWP
jgi:hypothetical protein